MTPCPCRDGSDQSERGQAALLLLGAMAALLVGALFLGAWGMALGARGKHQRAADLAAVSAARAMADAYPRLFEPPVLPDRAPPPRAISHSPRTSASAATPRCRPVGATASGSTRRTCASRAR